MILFLLAASLAVSGAFPSTIDRALALAQNRDWNGAAAALDQAAAEDPAAFSLNNLPYLRGRIAENQSDWRRAESEFLKIESGNVLRPLAAWHAAGAAIQLQDAALAERLIDELPAAFPADLKEQLAEIAPRDLALKIYGSLSSREARFEKARLTGDSRLIWALIRERSDDDVGLDCARYLEPAISSPQEMIDVADAYVAHRQFDRAFPLYQRASQSSEFAAQSRFQMARIQFLQENFKDSLSAYQAISRDFPDSDWQIDADYQIASCYWRLGEFRSAEKQYLAYISKYGSRGNQEGAIRNLVDVYRVLGQNQQALSWLDKSLARRLSAANRQVFLFTKAKVLYSQKRYTAAAQIFQQLSRTTIRPVAGNTTREEARYFQALSLSKAGQQSNAKAIWNDLASNSFSYYAVKSGEKLGRPGIGDAPLCQNSGDNMLGSVQAELASWRRPLRTDAQTPTDTVGELVFLGLWDEASLWNEKSVTGAGYLRAAQLAYAAGRFNRAISYASRLPSDDGVVGLIYPTGFRQSVCAEASKYKVDPLWLQAIIWQESKYNPVARSGASARGLMQFIPETANKVGEAIGMAEFSLDRLYEPAVSIQLGAYYWASLLKDLKSPVMALAAYNGGIDNVHRWKDKWPQGDDEFFVADIGFLETKRYVMAVFGARAAYGSLK